MKIYELIAACCIALLLFTSASGKVLYYHTDNFGTPMAMTNQVGEVVWEADELPFGEEYATEETPNKNNRRFLGKELDDETGLVYMGARYLDPKTGRFTQPDPVGLVDPASGKVNQEILLNPQRLNRYVYGLNNPYKYVDPDGNFALLGAALVGAAIAYLGSPDIANAPENSSTLTYESHGERSIIAGAVVGAGVGVVANVTSAALGAKALSKAGAQLDRGGLTKAGRALHKHGSREGSVFPQVTGNVASKNKQGQEALNGILKSKNRTVKNNRFGGKDIFDKNTGRGVRFDAEKNMKGFLEP